MLFAAAAHCRALQVPVEILIIAFSAGVFITFLVALVGIGTNSLVRQVFNNTLPFWGLLLFLWFDTFILTSLVEESKLAAASSTADVSGVLTTVLVLLQAASTSCRTLLWVTH